MHIDAFVLEQDPHAFDDVPKWVKPMIFPMHAEVAAVTIEYSLHDGRFWLPRARTAEGSATVSFMHMPFSLEQSFRYNSVNAAIPLPAIPLATPSRHPPRSTRPPRWRGAIQSAPLAVSCGAPSATRSAANCCPRPSSSATRAI